MADTVDIIITLFIAGIFLIMGFILGGTQSKNLGHDIKKNVLSALQSHAKGEIEGLRYNSNTGDYEAKLDNPDSTTKTTKPILYSLRKSRRETTSN